MRPAPDRVSRPNSHPAPPTAHRPAEGLTAAFRAPNQADTEDPMTDAVEPVTSLDQLDPDEPATWTCGHHEPWGPCGMFIQGGRRGLALHHDTVHARRAGAAR